MAEKTSLAVWVSVAIFATTCGLVQVASQREADAQAIRIGTYRPRFIVVFLDETGSRRKFWEPMRAKAALIASRLKNKDAFTVIGIDDHGGDEDDVRVPLSIVQVPNDLQVAALNQQRQAIVQKVLSLAPRGNPQRTDIVGPIKQALRVAKMESRDRDTVLAFFSDMQQEPRMPDAAAFRDIRFPNGTKAYCFYVAASGRYDFQKTVDIWRPLLNSAGVAIGENDFHQLGTVDVGVDGAFH